MYVQYIYSKCNVVYMNDLTTIKDGSGVCYFFDISLHTCFIF